MLTVIIYIFVALVTLCYLSDYVFTLSDKPGAPPRATSRVPLIGHLLGLIKLGTSYFTELSPQQNAEVYTLGIFSFKIYVINSRRLIPLVQRLSKTLSFAPFHQTAARAFIDCSAPTVELFGNLDFLKEFDKATRAALSPGPNLDYQNLRAVKSLNDCLEELLLRRSSNEKSVRIGLYEWSRHAITIASTNGVFGSSNPFMDKKIEDAFWTWNDGIPTLIAGLGIFAPKALKARQVLFDSFNTYLSGNYSDAAEVIKERIRVMASHGVPVDDIARQKTSFNIGVLSNTAPTTFWTLFNIFSRPELLRSLREELESQAVTKNKEKEHDEYELNITAIKTSGPLLLSVLEETQRTLTIHANIRKVISDTKLDSYHLAAGSYLQIPNAPIHRDAQLWGSDAGEFNPHRFMKKNEDGKAFASSLPSYSFLAWGAAPHLCPARQFAATEILTMIALLVLRVEMEPIGGGDWRRPEAKFGELVVILPPKVDIDVLIRPREGWEGNWVLNVGESIEKVPLTSG